MAPCTSLEQEKSGCIEASLALSAPRGVHAQRFAMNRTMPSVREHLIDGSCGYVLERAPVPLGLVVLVDQQGTDALGEVDRNHALGHAEVLTKALWKAVASRREVVRAW